MFEKLTHCPLCNSGHFHNHIICKDYTVSHEQFAIVQCDSCDFYFTNPRPEPQALPKYYESEDYISHQNKSNNLINTVYRFARSYTLKQKLKLVQHYKSGGKLLDIGCGTGHFLKTCQSGGFEVQGIEPSSTARQQAVDQNLTVFEDISSIPDSSTFDVITMWHVLEHIPNLNEFLQHVHHLLSSNGTLIVAVPNIESFDQKLYQQNWAAYDVPRHLYHFSQKTMQALMKKHSFKLINTSPMKLDAFYVSLLSEKYAHNGKTKYLQSFINGLKSNNYAKHHKNNYSSLIYIFSKK